MILLCRLKALCNDQLKRNVINFNSNENLQFLKSRQIKQTFSLSLSEKTDDSLKKSDNPPILPVACCGSGCQNCAWLQYAEEMLKFYGDSYTSPNSKDAIHVSIMNEINKLDDENLKSFLTMELKMKLKN